MASEEERARILAEYMQDADKAEDEEEFQAEDYDEEDDEDANSDDESHSDSDSDSHQHQTGGEPTKSNTKNNTKNKNKKDDNYAVLSGNLILNEEGRLVYSGTWCMKKDLEENQRIDEAERKKTKFKLKSKQNLNGKANATGTGTGKVHVFDLANPLLLVGEKKARTVLFDGFFTTDKTDTVQPHRKVKERDVELIFSQGVPMVKDGKGGKDDDDESKKEACFVVKGKGSNDFGAFSLEGIYCPNANAKTEGKDTGTGTGTGTGSHPLTCSKRYGVASGSKRGRDYDDSEEDYEISGDEAEAADMTELVGLADDNEMSVEELRKKYYGGTCSEEQDGDGDGDGNGKEETKSKQTNEKEKDSKAPATKRSKIVDEDDDDDDGCGF